LDAVAGGVEGQIWVVGDGGLRLWWVVLWLNGGVIVVGRRRDFILFGGG
jgi:hypothetical protein